MNKLGIYIHIPFCESKCIYCDFASFCCAEQEKDKYFQFLRKEIERCDIRGREVDTIYIGGGTPSCVEEGYLEEIIFTLKENYIFSKDMEISIECNPNSIDFEKLKKYNEFGINRISFGVQSLHDNALKTIGRLHTSEMALQAIKMAKKAGFNNINADLLIGLPNSTIGGLCEDAEKLINAGVTHISAYMLQVEEGAKLFSLVKSGKLILPSDDESVSQYDALVSFLEKRGFSRYEISNFALENFECKHNLKYWSGSEYLGFGLSAHSYLGNIRQANSRNFMDYYKGKISKEILTNEDMVEEKIMLGLRCRLGFSLKELSVLGYDITKNQNFQNFVDKGILKVEKGIVRLKPEYYGTSNYIIANLLP